jgi:hypothetical protein
VKVFQQQECRICKYTSHVRVFKSSDDFFLEIDLLFILHAVVLRLLVNADLLAEKCWLFGELAGEI